MSNAENKNCPQCGAPLEAAATTCKYCGAAVTATPQYSAPQQQAPIYTQQAPQYAPQYAPPQQPMYTQPQTPPPGYYPYANTKSKVVAGILAILLGGLGIHKFYTGHIGLGILYLIFCWAYIPAIIGVVEGIIYLTSSDEKFNAKYVKH